VQVKLRLVYRKIHWGYTHLIIKKILPTLWPNLSKLLIYISKRKSLVIPSGSRFKSANVLVGKKRYDARGPDLVNATIQWAKYNLEIDDVCVSHKILKQKKDIVIVTHDWLKFKSGHHKLFLNIIFTSIRLRIRNQPVWILIPDAFNLQWTIAASILVSMCGGAIILQSNTSKEALNFGLVFPVGPVLWTLNSYNYNDFYTKVDWLKRERVAIFAKSGDGIRVDIYNNYSKFLVEQEYLVKYTEHQLSWVAYQELVKNSRITITTSSLQNVVKKINRKISGMLPNFVATHRIWEGFCSGCVVITNKNSILDSLGFKPKQHYIDLDEMLDCNFKLPSDRELYQISSAGNKLFMSLIAPNKFQN